MSSSIVLAILVTSFATYLSRFLGVVSSEKLMRLQNGLDGLIV